MRFAQERIEECQERARVSQESLLEQISSRATDRETIHQLERQKDALTRKLERSETELRDWLSQRSRPDDSTANRLQRLEKWSSSLVKDEL